MCGSKRQLQLLIPPANCFLDVDNLKDISDLEENVAESANVLMFVSRGCESCRSNRPLVVQRSQVPSPCSQILSL